MKLVQVSLVLVDRRRVVADAQLKLFGVAEKLRHFDVLPRALRRERVNLDTHLADILDELGVHAVDGGEGNLCPLLLCKYVLELVLVLCEGAGSLGGELLDLQLGGGAPHVRIVFLVVEFGLQLGERPHLHRALVNDVLEVAHNVADLSLLKRIRHVEFTDLHFELFNRLKSRAKFNLKAGGLVAVTLHVLLELGHCNALLFHGTRLLEDGRERSPPHVERVEAGLLLLAPPFPRLLLELVALRPRLVDQLLPGLALADLILQPARVARETLPGVTGLAVNLRNLVGNSLSFQHFAAHVCDSLVLGFDLRAEGAAALLELLLLADGVLVLTLLRLQSVVRFLRSLCVRLYLVRRELCSDGLHLRLHGADNDSGLLLVDVNVAHDSLCLQSVA
eukprot:PhM_4_TR9475/c1_g1_i1/m.2132